MKQTLIIDGELPALNEIIKAATSLARVGRKQHSRYTDLKRRWNQTIALLCRVQRITPHRRARFAFRWISPSRRRDPDNIACGGRKLILDALVQAGVIPDDGWDEVLGWSDEFSVDKRNPRVEVDIIDE